VLRAARREVHRRRARLGGATGPELEDIASQAAGDSVLAILENLDNYRGLSRFTTRTKLRAILLAAGYPIDDTTP
jgi:RNA polymerase sigma-70 factor (ECF subfamily)